MLRNSRLPARKSRSAFGAWLTAGSVFTIWLLYVLGSLAVTVGLIYAAFHFITKYW